MNRDRRALFRKVAEPARRGGAISRASPVQVGVVGRATEVTTLSGSSRALWPRDRRRAGCTPRRGSNAARCCRLALSPANSTAVALGTRLVLRGTRIVYSDDQNSVTPPFRDTPRRGSRRSSHGRISAGRCRRRTRSLMVPSAHLFRRIKTLSIRHPVCRAQPTYISAAKIDFDRCRLALFPRRRRRRRFFPYVSLLSRIPPASVAARAKIADFRSQAREYLRERTTPAATMTRQ